MLRTPDILIASFLHQLLREIERGRENNIPLNTKSLPVFFGNPFLFSLGTANIFHHKSGAATLSIRQWLLQIAIWSIILKDQSWTKLNNVPTMGTEVQLYEQFFELSPKRPYLLMLPCALWTCQWWVWWCQPWSQSCSPNPDLSASGRTSLTRKEMLGSGSLLLWKLWMRGQFPALTAHSQKKMVVLLLAEYIITKAGEHAFT